MSPFEIIRPDSQTPFLASIPHSGMIIPYEAAKCFTPEHYSSLVNTDWYIDRLYEFLPSIGVTVIKNNIYKYVIDVNRDTIEPLYGNYKKSVVPSAVPDGTPCNWKLYQKEPTNEEIHDRVQQYYEPYHNELSNTINNIREKFGKVFLLDLHSYVGGLDEDICLGNCNGKTCPDDYLESFYKKLEKCKLRVVKNKVFTGGFITKKYYIPDTVLTMQIEIRSGCFINQIELDQGRPPKLNQEKMAPIQESLKTVISQIIQESIG